MFQAQGLVGVVEALLSSLDEIGFADPDGEVNGGDCVEVINQHLDALRACVHQKTSVAERARIWEGDVLPPQSQLLSDAEALLADIARHSVASRCLDAKQAIASVMMQDVVGDYEVPEDVPEWAWVEKAASFAHVRNGQSGVWEFVLNLSLAFEDVPDSLKPVLESARQSHLSYLVFHQGT